MKKVLQVITTMMIVAMVSGCGPSKEEIEKTVKSSMQESFDKDLNSVFHNLKVDSVSVFKTGDNSYKGLVSIVGLGWSKDITVEILVDGNKVMWETSPETFSFLF